MTGATMLRGDLFRLTCGWRMHAYRLIFAGVLCAFMAIEWPTGENADLHQAGRNMLGALVWCEFLAAGVLIPIFVAPAIAGERERGTLELLAACPQTEADLVVGRSLSHVLFGTSLLLAGAPFAIAAILIGGAPASRAISACVHALMTGVFATLVSMVASTIAKDRLAATTSALMGHLLAVASGGLLGTVVIAISTGSAAGVTFVLVFFALGGFMTHLGATRKLRAAQSIGAILLIISWGTAAFVGSSGSPGWIPISNDMIHAVTCPWAKYVEDVASAAPLATNIRVAAWVSHAVLSFFIILWLGHLSRRGRLLMEPGQDLIPAHLWTTERRVPAAPVRTRPPVRFAPNPRLVFGESTPSAGEALSGAQPGIPLAMMPRPEPRVASRRFAHGGPPLVTSAQRRAARAALPVRGNPVFWKETAIPKNPVSGCALAFLISIVGISGIFSLSGSHFGGDRWNGSHGGLVLDLFIAGLFIVPLMSAIFAPERGDGTLPLLLATGYEPWQILFGKIAAVGWHLRALVVIIGIHLALMVLDTGGRGMLITLVFMSSLGCVAAMAAACAAVFRDSRAALGMAFVCAAVLWFAPVVASTAGRLHELAGFNPFSLIIQLLGNYSRIDSDAVGMGLTWCVAQGIFLTLALAIAIPALERRMRT